MNNELEVYKEKTFEEIKHVSEDGVEFWYARELQIALDYTEWRKFLGVINKAKDACKLSHNSVDSHFVGTDKIVKAGATTKTIKDYMLTRYACYLIVQNADSRKTTIALGQTYFAMQTRKQEFLEEEVKHLTEEEKRLKLRTQVKDGNKTLNDTVYEIGARTNKEFAKFHNEGYKGLYGQGVNKIREHKGLKKSDNVLDYMGSTELAANWFRITQADEMLKNNKIDTLEEANKTHNKAGKEVRKTMIRLSGVKPEDLPTPQRSINEIEKEELKKLKNK